MSRERLGSALPAMNDVLPGADTVRLRHGPGARPGEVVTPRKAVEGIVVDSDAEAEAFIRFCYRRRAVAWPELYDEMCAVAARGDYRGMDYEGLSDLGIGFTLAALPRLAQLANRVIAQERLPRPIAVVA